MKKLFLLLICTSTVLSGCKKDDGDTPSDDLTEKLTTDLELLYQAGVVYSNEFQQSGDTLAAANAMRVWLANNAEVSGGWVHNRDYFEVHFANGLRSPINIVQVKPNGEHVRRGGGKDGFLNSFQFKSIQSEKIKNRKVLVLMPYTMVFGYDNNRIEAVRSAIEGSNKNLEADIQVNGQVTLDDLDRLSDYGMIILDVHGLKNGFYLEYVNETFSAQEAVSAQTIIDEVTNEHNVPKAKLENGQIEIGMTIELQSDGSTYFKYLILITEDYIRQLNIDLTGAVLFGNHCFSGHTATGPTEYNMSEAWRSKGLSTYYGYAGADGNSGPADNDFCRQMELNLLNGLVAEGDTTGIAHLDPLGDEYSKLIEGFSPTRALVMTEMEEAEGWTLYLKQFFDRNYRYEPCGEPFTDPRDGRIYQTVCIGEQQWMAQNLRYFDVDNWCYNNDPSWCNSENGRYYTWQNAILACPDGWHLPSIEEWQQLTDELGGPQVAGGKMKSTTGYWNYPNGGATNSSGFNALGSGALTPPSDFSWRGYQEYFWTSTEDTPDRAVRTILQYINANIEVEGTTLKNNGLMCRCIKDE